MITDHPDYPKDLPESNMNANDVIFDATNIYKKYNLLINSLRSIIDNTSCCIVCECTRCDVVSALKEVGEWQSE